MYYCKYCDRTWQHAELRVLQLFTTVVEVCPTCNADVVSVEQTDNSNVGSVSRDLHDRMAVDIATPTAILLAGHWGCMTLYDDNRHLLWCGTPTERIAEGQGSGAYWRLGVHYDTPVCRVTLAKGDMLKALLVGRWKDRRSVRLVAVETVWINDVQLPDGWVSSITIDTVLQSEFEYGSWYDL